MEKSEFERSLEEPKNQLFGVDNIHPNSSTGSAVFHKRVADNFGNGRKILQRKRNRGDIDFQGNLDFPWTPKRVKDVFSVKIPEPLNKARLFDLDEKRLLKMAENIGNSFFTLAVYHGIYKFMHANRDLGNVERDPRTHLFRSLSGEDTLYLLAEFGQVNFPGATIRLDTLLPEMSEHEIPAFFGFPWQNIRHVSLPDFIFDSIQSGRRLGKSFGYAVPMINATRVQSGRTIQNLKTLDSGNFLEELIRQYETSISFVNMFTYPRKKEFSDIRYVNMKGNSVSFGRKEHPYQSYMKSVINFLRMREVKLDNENKQ